MDKEKLIKELYELDLTLTKEEQDEVDYHIKNEEKQVNIYKHLKNNCLILSILITLSIFSLNLLVIQLPLIVILLYLFLVFRKKHYMHSVVLIGLKQSAEEFRHNTIKAIREGFFD
jgi:hypothetical protein